MVKLGAGWSSERDILISESIKGLGRNPVLGNLPNLCSEKEKKNTSNLVCIAQIPLGVLTCS